MVILKCLLCILLNFCAFLDDSIKNCRSTGKRSFFSMIRVILHTGGSLVEKEDDLEEETPSRPVRAVRSRQNTLEEILVSTEMYILMCNELFVLHTT